MASLDQEEKDALSARILQRLSETPYACSSLTLLSGGSANFVFRGILAPSVCSKATTGAKTIIVKHFADFLAVNRNFKLDVSRCFFEASMLNALNTTPPTRYPIFEVPRLHLFDCETNTQVHQDFPGAIELKSIFLASPPISRLLVTSIGRDVGSRLRSFHTWASEPAQAALRADIGRNEPMRKLKYSTSYNTFINVLEKYPELVEECRKTLEEVKDMATREFHKTATEEEGEDWGIIHGDFWTGNVLLANIPSAKLQQHGEANKLLLFDWELAQFGHRAYDLGQMIGDLCERKYLDNDDGAIWVIEGFMDGYGMLSDEMAFRTAIHAGVHFIHWCIRRPHMASMLGSPERVAYVMKIGRDFILKGWERDKIWFRDTVLAPLFNNQ